MMMAMMNEKRIERKVSEQKASEQPFVHEVVKPVELFRQHGRRTFTEWGDR